MKLYDELIKIRDELRVLFFDKKTNRAPTVCNDAALAELAKKAPRTAEEFAYINGCGRVFAERYAAYFLPALDRFHAQNDAKKIMSPAVFKTLKNFEKRLVGINQKNRLLFLNRLYKKNSFDLNTGVGASVVDFLLSKQRRGAYKICPFPRGGDAPEQKAETAVYEHVRTLAREAARSERESGIAELYVGYPFVLGRVEAEDFDLRAPLALFPVTAAVNEKGAFLSLDGERDVLYNSNLIFSYYKFNGIRREPPYCAVEEIEKDFIGQIKSFYESAGIKIEGEASPPQKFAPLEKSEFKKLNGKFTILHNAVLGTFSLYSSALQKDYKNILEGGGVNALADALLNPDAAPAPAPDPPAAVDERAITYVNELNASQESLIAAVSSHGGIVLHGPPGTGKSQTIVSAIADIAVRGGNVLMVSQKRAALDVIHSRLGELSKYALFIPDSLDKDFFYGQIKTIFSLAQNEEKTPALPFVPSIAAAAPPSASVLSVPAPPVSPEGVGNGGVPADGFSLVADAVNSALARLDAGAAAIKNGGLCRIYEENPQNIFFADPAAFPDEYAALTGTAAALNYDGLRACAAAFTGNKAADAELFLTLRERYPWLASLKTLTGTELISAKNYAETFPTRKSAAAALPFFKRLSALFKLKKDIKKFAKKNFSMKGAAKIFYAEPSAPAESLDNFSEYHRASKEFFALAPEQRGYAESVYSYCRARQRSFSESLPLVYDCAVFALASDIEHTLRDHIACFNAAPAAVDAVNEQFKIKRNLTRDAAAAALCAALNEHVFTSKRFLEMRRKLESKRRQSIAAFVKNFEFELTKGVRVWLLTPETVSELLPLTPGLFDVVIFDEASQLYVENGIPSVLRADGCVVAGDHKQLRPSNLGFGRGGGDEEFEDGEESDAAVEEESLLDLARFKLKSVLLNFHYRSKYDELIAFSNRAFYDGGLCALPSPSPSAEPPISVVYDPSGVWESRRNLCEAKAVLRVIRDFLYGNAERKTMGVITFNSAQRDLIEDLLDAEKAADPDFAARLNAEFSRKSRGEDVGLFVKNIENVQGDERDIIVFSLAYARDESGKIPRQYGWLSQSGGENRLNVGISRAKEKIIIVASVRSGELKTDDLKNDGPKLFKKYLEYAEYISRGDVQNAEKLLAALYQKGGPLESDASVCAKELAAALTAKGCRVEQNYGVAGFPIELCASLNGKTVGVEFDKTALDSFTCARRFVHRSNFLKLRGWNLLTFTASDWRRSPDRVLSAIESRLNADK
ncbi:MAG: HRDC domain-containing protein [Clostridiales bacterium]|jgi:hypothetical protein|nr:HRDC domain-containing protein [Clostridiales bacterium]